MAAVPGVELPSATSFDFLVGGWHVHNDRLADVLPERTRDEWQAFESVVEARAILGGAGVVDTYRFPDFPGRGLFHGFALRLVDRATDEWRVWWAASHGSGVLDPPVVGRFADGEGHFSGTDVYAGRPIRVRTQYTEITSASLRWEQAFSFDDGRSFETNWIMRFRRAASPSAGEERAQYELKI